MKGGKEVRDLMELRKKLKVNQKELAEILGVSQAQVSRIESGLRELSLAQFGELCQALKLTNEIQQELIDEAMKQSKPKRSKISKAQD